MTYGDLMVEMQGRRLFARTLGEGPPVVLLHSLLANSFSFEPLAKQLSSTHKVLLVDLPGFGGSTPVPGSLADIADHVAQCLPSLTGSDQATVIGNGYGSFITLMLAIRHPALVHQFVLAGCGARFSDQGREAFRQMSRAAHEKGLQGVADVAMRRLFSEAFQLQHPALSETCRQEFLKLNPDTFHAACAALATLDATAELTAVTSPSLIMVGEYDEATPPAMARELANALADSRFRLLHGCAHVPQLQDPAYFHAEVMAFFTREAVA
jgi:3-oxoadipate enol-lactonase